ncbi:ABC transporter substrate-binding protein [Microbacterium sp. bgisy203]|uniref:ABC transporter substrate-binding protein n=1 Tax=Microbacterium sp. bgisy203 TaxID=3413799 RepID=UPI003D754440
MIRNAKRSGAVAAVIGASVLVLGLAGCSAGGSNDAGGDDGGKTLRVWAGSQTPIVANYNPFAPTVLHGALGPVYETLFAYNKTADTEPTGLLAESYEFNEDGTQITIKLKDGVKWNDGKPFTAKDVVFTFEYEGNKANAPTKAEAPDDATVVLTYDTPQFTREFQILGATWMLPEHVWSEVDDFTTFTDEEPVGTGPYKVQSTSDSSYTLVANENFRDEGVPAVKKVQYIAIDANQSAQDLLKAGKLDWTGMFVPNPDDVTSGGTISCSTPRKIRRCSTPARTSTSAARASRPTWPSDRRSTSLSTAAPSRRRRS